LPAVLQLSATSKFSTTNLSFRISSNQDRKRTPPQNTEKIEKLADGGAKYGANSEESRNPDLEFLVKSWTDIPEVLRTAIVAMVKASCKSADPTGLRVRFDDSRYRRPIRVGFAANCVGVTFVGNFC
jgi:hypothetical protein